MAQTPKKKDREKRRQQERNVKAEKMQQRRENATKKSFEEMIAYLDENGNLTSQPPDPRKKIEVKLEDIQISVPEYVPHEEESARTGKVTFFNNAKGFGFIKDHASQESIFVHVHNVESAITENDQVSFEIEQGQRGPAAVKVKLIN
jgi:cold shock CspA family protein